MAVLELFDSAQCSADPSAGDFFGLRNGTLANDADGPPASPYYLTEPPPFSNAEWYFLARYNDGGVCDVRSPSETCCGLLREMTYQYQLYRDLVHPH